MSRHKLCRLVVIISLLVFLGFLYTQMHHVPISLLTKLRKTVFDTKSNDIQSQNFNEDSNDMSSMNLGVAKPETYHPPTLISTDLTTINPAVQLNYEDFVFDDTKKSIHLWPKDPLCSKYYVRFIKNYTGGWLATFPRSGNTWTRYLLEASTGVFTSSVYNDKELEKKGFLGEKYSYKQKNSLLTKTHDFKLRDIKDRENVPVVTIIRNPARSIVSLWNYNSIKDKKYKMTSSVNESTYESEGFHKHAMTRIDRWKRFYNNTLENAKTLHVVFYEKLRETPLREVRSILRFLRVNTDEGRLSCILTHLEGHFKGRQRKVNPYNKTELIKISEAIAHVSSLLIKRGFPPLPDYTNYDN